MSLPRTSSPSCGPLQHGNRENRTNTARTHLAFFAVSRGEHVDGLAAGGLFEVGAGRQPIHRVADLAHGTGHHRATSLARQNLPVLRHSTSTTAAPSPSSQRVSEKVSLRVCGDAVGAWCRPAAPTLSPLPVWTCSGVPLGLCGRGSERTLSPDSFTISSPGVSVSAFSSLATCTSKPGFAAELAWGRQLSGLLTRTHHVDVDHVLAMANVAPALPSGFTR